MSEPTIAELEQRLKEADAVHLAVLDEQMALSEAQLALFAKHKTAMVAASEARAAWETARRGGPLEPGEVAEELRRAGLTEPERLLLFERAAHLAPLPYEVWIRPLTAEGREVLWSEVREPLLEAGYQVGEAHEKRYRLKGDTAARYYAVMGVQRPVLEAHRTVAEDDAAWQEEVDTMAGETPPAPDWRGRDR